MEFDIQILIDFFEQNKYAVFILLLLSIIANIIQVYSYIESKKLTKKERLEKEKLSKLLDRYQYLLNLKDESEKSEKELVEKNTILQEMNEKINHLEKVAKKNTLDKEIERYALLAKTSLEEVEKLREDYKELGDLKDVPENQKNAIKELINQTLGKDKEIPNDFVVKAILSALIILMFPFTINRIIILVFLPFIFEVAFKSFLFINNEKFRNWITDYASFFGWWVTAGLWLSVLKVFFGAFSLRLLEQFMEFPRPEVAESVNFFLIGILSIGIGTIHWEKIKKIAFPDELIKLIENKKTVHNNASTPLS